MKQKATPSTEWYMGFTPIIIILVLLILFIIGFIVYKTHWPKVSATVNPQNYEECIKSPGSVVMTMYPAVCVTKSGARFTEPLTQEQQQNLTPPTTTPTPSVEPCGPNGTRCGIANCPTCPAGKNCIRCDSVTVGTCQNNICIPLVIKP